MGGGLLGYKWRKKKLRDHSPKFLNSMKTVSPQIKKAQQVSKHKKIEENLMKDYNLIA